MAHKHYSSNKCLRYHNKIWVRVLKLPLLRSLVVVHSLQYPIMNLSMTGTSMARSMESSRLKEASPVWRRPRPSKSAIRTDRKAPTTSSTQYSVRTGWVALRFSAAIATFLCCGNSTQTDSRVCTCRRYLQSKSLARAITSSLTSAASS